VAVVSEKPGVTGSIHAKIGAPTLDPERASITSMKRDRSNENQPESDIVIADTYLQKQTIDSTKKAIEHYDLAMAVLKQRNKPRKGMVGAIHFRLGVAYRSLYDLSKPADQDPVWFTKAATSWTNALNENPNQYIWRRRIQQYGPRQMKPYPFYDWVEKAQQEIAARGETPIELTVALSKAEIAQPNRKFTSETTSENPDPEGKIKRLSASIQPSCPTKLLRARPREFICDFRQTKVTGTMRLNQWLFGSKNRRPAKFQTRC
jgi:hypothetical protein